MIDEGNVTPWFDAHLHDPVREGFYEIQFVLLSTGKHGRTMRALWSRGEWQMDFTAGPFGKVRGDQWRGLAAPARGVALRPCRSPYCECDPGKCTHPGCYDARGVRTPDGSQHG